MSDKSTSRYIEGDFTRRSFSFSASLVFERGKVLHVLFFQAHKIAYGERARSVPQRIFRGKDKLKMSNNTNANKQVQTSIPLTVTAG